MALTVYSKTRNKALVNFIVFEKMENMKLRRSRLPAMLLTIVFWELSFQVSIAAASPQVAAMFVFGDSLTDNGNNNYLNSLAKANYDPYGIDFPQGSASGRFSNGNTIIDYLGDFLGLPLLPAYANPDATGSGLLQGVNYASASAGILEETGRNLGERISFRQQVENFASNLEQLKNEMKAEQLTKYLKKSLTVVIMGSNDYINNYLLTSFYATSYIYPPTTYTDLLIQQYTKRILALYSLGLRKFLIAGIGPLGCIPNQLANNFAPPGKCASLANDLAVMFNTQLRSLVSQLNTNYTDAIFVYGNTYGAVSDIITNSRNYGFTVTDSGCCGIGRNQGEITCLPFSAPCVNRDQHVFWDAFHPTQAANRILAEKAYNGPPSDCYPMNVKQMAEL
ncbi:putative triacylglycerol lipase [Helianthus annuus]|uniref:Putative GDSL-like Lipase/Acylhydrolase superfamily protein n=1 Tax=Helianthus annuus TaxID=4232 RepID=A0A251T4V7_HELAN|nr:GDSL esterase/lipase At5g08460 [Helianthus annuus]KAF5778935.1 putative triacylglycerol lipase [Helianthus annuus]KAJ0490276.1 putative triacylglycerol lipase [Helianthus annuus]KAJ0506194.1 putative triacylglycerol lipase [Helianthus annuus]KAJ0675865.1 putative triacylglycerol lipase [Helianthus annuus]KAJ0679116.1 putative triacylglycerol lipase [Helianthus annuus]